MFPFEKLFTMDMPESVVVIHAITHPLAHNFHDNIMAMAAVCYYFYTRFNMNISPAYAAAHTHTPAKYHCT